MAKSLFVRAAVLSLLVGCAGGGIPTESGWREVDSPHFHVLTDLDSGEARDTAETFERLREAILAWYGGELDPPATVIAVVYSGQGAFRARGADNLAGFWVPSFGGRLLVSTRLGFTSLARGANEVDAHELAHELNAFFLLRQPRWLGEGLANYFSTVSVENGRARFGRPSQEWLWWLRDHRPLPLAKLWAWDHEDVEKLSAGELQERYVSSALWVHYLENERGVRFDDFKRRLRRGEPPREAFDAAFAHLDEATMYRELETYVGRIFPVRQLMLGKTPVPLTERALSKAEVAVVQAETWLQGPGNESAAARRAWIRGKVAEALALDPKLGDARRLDVVLAPKDERVKKAKALTQALPADGRAWHLYANLLPKGDPQVLPACEKAAALAPDDPQALADAALAEVNAGHQAAALADAQKADALAPWDPQVAHAKAIAEWFGKDCTHAASDLARAIDLLYDGQAPNYRRRLQEQLDGIRMKCKPSQ